MKSIFLVLTTIVALTSCSKSFDSDFTTASPAASNGIKSNGIVTANGTPVVTTVLNYLSLPYSGLIQGGSSDGRGVGSIPGYNYLDGIYTNTVINVNTSLAN